MSGGAASVRATAGAGRASWRTRLLSYLIFFLSWSFSAAGQAAPKVDVRVFPGSITVGDRVEVELTVAGGGDEAPRFPLWRQGWGEAEVLDAGGVERVRSAGGAVWRQRVVLTGFEPGVLALPAVEVVVPVGGRAVGVRTPEKRIEVRSVLPPGNETPEPKPAAPPGPLPIGARFWWTAAGGALLLAAAIALYARRQAAAEGAAKAPRLAPLPELLGELDRLAAEESAVKAHTRLSQALRRYLGRTLGFAALERTTTEIQRALTGAAAYRPLRRGEGSPGVAEGIPPARRLSAPLVRRAVELLRACDLVKFARQEVGRERTLERLAAARELAADVEREARPPEVAAGTGGAAASREAA